MKTYEIIAELKSRLAGLDEANEDPLYQICWSMTPALAKAIEGDLKGIAGGDPRVASFEIQLKNPDHQHSDSLIAHVRYDPWDPFDVVLTMLPQHGAIYVFVRNRPRKPELDRIADTLDRGQFTHLRGFYA